MNRITRIESTKAGGYGSYWLEAPTPEQFDKHVEEMNAAGWKLMSAVYANEGYTLLWEKI